MVQIITDSAADLQPQEYEQLGVTCIPLRVAFGDDEYQENVDLSKDQFFALLAMALIAVYSGEKLTRSRAVQWGFYLFYPVHLILLGMILRFIR